MPGEISDHDIERELQTLRYVQFLSIFTWTSGL